MTYYNTVLLKHNNMKIKFNFQFNDSGNEYKQVYHNVIHFSPSISCIVLHIFMYQFILSCINSFFSRNVHFNFVKE